jgi:hypothetical protein
VIVIDSRTLLPIPDACIVVGTTTCDPTRPHTDASGRWSVDIPMSTSTTNWDMGFLKAGYFTQWRTFTLQQGRTALFEIRLVRIR